MYYDWGDNFTNSPNGITAPMNVIDILTNDKITAVVRCDTAEGWLVRCKTNDDGRIIVPGVLIFEQRSIRVERVGTL